MLNKLKDLAVRFHYNFIDEDNPYEQIIPFYGFITVGIIVVAFIFNMNADLQHEIQKFENITYK